MKYLLDQQETNRLKFRLLEDDDFDIWINLFRQPGVSIFIGLGHISTPDEQCKLWFEKCYNRYHNDLGGMNVLVDKQTNELIGQSGLLVQTVNGVTLLEIGYSILPKYWNKGYATEAAKKCKDYAFQNNFIDSLVSIIHIDNVNSAKVAINNGMKLDTTTEYVGMPVNIYKITKADWSQ